MDCKPETAMRTLIRMFLISVQGVGMALVLFLCGVLLAPFTPFWFTCVALKERPAGVLKWVLIPLWWLHGLAYSIRSPFVVFWKTLQTTYGLVVIEWVERWQAANPKQPNGDPLAV